MEWISKNADWLFNGAAVAIPIAIIGWLASSRQRKNRKQVQKSGNHSTNIQIGKQVKKHETKKND